MKSSVNKDGERAPVDPAAPVPGAAPAPPSRQAEEHGAARHTPGPWHLDTSLHVYGMVPSTDPVYPDGTLQSEHVCTAKRFANAALIAAAPDLLDALAELLDAIDASVKAMGVQRAITVPADRARAALAKARGDTSRG